MVVLFASYLYTYSNISVFIVEEVLDFDDVVANELEDVVDVDVVITLVDIMVELVLVVGVVLDVVVIVLGYVYEGVVIVESRIISVEIVLTIKSRRNYNIIILINIRMILMNTYF